MAAHLAHSHKQYLKTQIDTASQPQLLLMLFEGAVKKLHLAKKAIAERAIEKSHQELTKVQRIFVELMIALDLEKGGEIAANLLRIYDFIYHRLVQANIRQNAAIIDELLPIIEDLRSGWIQAVEIFNSEQKNAAGKPLSSSAPAVLPASSQKLSTETAKKPETTAKSPVKPPARNPYARPAKAAAESPQERPRLNIRG
ncbi:MAG: flagellar export chaperone FliS [Candidatus Omnitrophota bacterium]